MANSDTGKRGTLRAREGRQREEYAEFALMKRDRDAYDSTAWHASVTARQRMPALSSVALDPGLDAVAPTRGREGHFIGDGDVRATVRAAEPPQEGVGFVTAVEISARSSFLPGTLVVRVTPESTQEVDPRSLHLFRWNAAAKRYDLLLLEGVNIRGGYVWGRVTQPGHYAVFGVPSAGLKVERIKAEHLQPLLLIIVREFSPTGPWELLGPRHLSCCILDLAIDPANNDRIYAAASDGGVWRLDSLTAYPGHTWTPLTDQQPSLAINCMAVSRADSSVVYYIDRSGRLYRSPDRGLHWTLPGPTAIGGAYRLLAHPTEANTIYVASQLGLWCSTTGGATWTSNPGQTTLLDGDVTDVAMDPGDPTVLYVGQRSVGVLKSSNSGGTWQTVLPWSSANSPVGTMIKVAVGSQGTEPNRTVVAKLDQEVFLNRHGGRGPTTAGGGPWTSLGKQGGSGYGDWCHVVAVDPFDDNVILAGAQQLFRTGDGGGSWNVVIDYYAPHEDQHRVVFDPTQTGVVYAANDGGVFRSSDGGVTWQTSGGDLHARHDLTLGLVTAQFYTAGVSGDNAVGDAYHQGLLGATSLAAQDWSGIEGHAWEFNNVFGDPVRYGRFYVFSPTALFRRHFPDPGSGPALVQIASFRPTAIAVDGRPGSNVLLAGTAGGQVMRAPDGDTDTPTWTAMPGIGLSGGDAVTSMAFAPSRPQQAYALTSSGEVFLCTDADTTGWSACTGLPSGEGVSIAVSVEHEDHLYAISSSQVFRSVDGAGSWTPVPGAGLHQLPSGLNLRSIVAGPGTVYLAASSGVFTSPDAGQHWFPYSDGLPNVEIKELLWTEGDLFAVTHGRGLWHHGRYDIFVVPPIAHIPDIPWLIELWLAIHGGDPPAPDAIRQIIGRGFDPGVRAGR